MLKANLSVRTLSPSILTSTDHQHHPTTATSLSTNPIASSSSSSSFPATSYSSIRLCFANKRRRFHLHHLCSSNSSRRRVLTVRSSNAANHNHNYDHDHDHDDFVEASLLLPETISHYRMRRRGFFEGSKMHSSGSAPGREQRGGRDVTSIGHHFFRRFQSPTIFLKISCFGDYLLPIIVGEFAIERLIDALWGDSTGSCPDQFQFVLDVVERLGYEVKMVRITERVANTYFAKLYLSEPGENKVISVDLRPSDAINVANRCKAPIYVSKEIFMTDAVRIGRLRTTKPTYDVYLDSAIDGPDLLTEELDLLRNMDIAVKEERFKDAAKLRDKLMKLRNYRDDL